MMNVQPLSQSVNHWQFIYIASIMLALLATFAIVAFAFHWEQHKTALRFSNYVYALFSLVALIATIVIVNKTNLLDAEKDRQVKIATAASDLKIAQANESAAQANKKAQEAKDEAEKLETDNLKLSGQVGKDAVTARAAEAALDAKNKETSDFAHALEQQQGVMAEQAKVSPQLTNYQVQALANILKPYAGQDVELHITAETVVGRLGAEIKAAFNIAGVTTSIYSTEMGSLYQGLSVAVHDPSSVPPIANALMTGFRQAGIDAHPVAAPERVASGKVAIFIGPN